MYSDISLAGYSVYKKRNYEISLFNFYKNSSLIKHNLPTALKQKFKFAGSGKISSVFTYHDKAMWAYIIKKDKNNKEFTTTNRSLDFEMITSDKVLKLRLRNADVKDTTLENIDITSSGITVHGTKIGDIYKPNQWREVSIIALAVGDIDASGVVNFIFTNQVITILIKGTRAVIFSYRPAYNYTESKVYKTSIFTSQNGKEVRYSLADGFKKKVSFSVTSKEIESGVAEILSFAMQRYCLVPLWNSTAISKTSGMLNVLTCDTTLKEFDKYLVVWRNFKDYEFAKILNLSDDKIIIDKQVSINTGDFIIPLLKSTPKQSLNYSVLTSEVKSYELEFMELL